MAWAFACHEELNHCWQVQTQTLHETMQLLMAQRYLLPVDLWMCCTDIGPKVGACRVRLLLGTWDLGTRVLGMLQERMTCKVSNMQTLCGSLCLPCPSCLGSDAHQSKSHTTLVPTPSSRLNPDQAPWPMRSGSRHPSQHLRCPWPKTFRMPLSLPRPLAQPPSPPELAAGGLQRRL